MPALRRSITRHFRPIWRRPRLGTARRAGVTLIDLVITILVIGILSAVALPRFVDAVDRLRTEAVARRIASDLNYARRMAIQSSRTVTVTFVASPAGYQMAGVVHPDHPSQSYAVGLADLDSTVALKTFQFNGGGSLSFNTYGRPLVGVAALVTGTVEVSSGNRVFTVVVDPATGESSVP